MISAVFAAASAGISFLLLRNGREKRRNFKLLSQCAVVPIGALLDHPKTKPHIACIQGDVVAESCSLVDGNNMDCVVIQKILENVYQEGAYAIQVKRLIAEHTNRVPWCLADASGTCVVQEAETAVELTKSFSHLDISAQPKSVVGEILDFVQLKRFVGILTTQKTLKVGERLLVVGSPVANKDQLTMGRADNGLFYVTRKSLPELIESVDSGERWTSRAGIVFGVVGLLLFLRFLCKKNAHANNFKNKLVMKVRSFFTLCMDRCGFICADDAPS